MKTGQAVTVTGRVDQGSDGAFYSRKRLIIHSIEPYVLQSSSLKDWKLIFHHAINYLRLRIYTSLQENLPPYQAGLVLAIVFGTTEWLPITIEPYFEITGTLHILAASGQNVALMLLMVEPLLPEFFSTKVRGVLLIFTVCIYLTIVGLQPALTRAALMAVLMLLSRYFLFCRYSAIYALMITFTVLVLHRPEWLISIGFMLSVMATLGIIILYPLISSFISRVFRSIELFIALKPPFSTNTISLYISESIAVGIAAQITTFPIIFTQIGTAQLLSFIPSTIVAWLLPLMMMATVVLIFLNLVSNFIPSFQTVAESWSLIMVWLPTDLFIFLLNSLAQYQWGTVSNPWHV